MESKKEILQELNGHLAAACDCFSFIRDGKVSDPNSITKSDKEWATKTYNDLLKFMDQARGLSK